MAKPIIECCLCHEMKTHEAKGMCKPCYNRTRKVICVQCGKEGTYGARGLCAKCYHLTPARQARIRVPVARPIIKCWWCWSDGAHYAFRLCNKCYHALPERAAQGRVQALEWYFNNQERSHSKRRELLLNPETREQRRAHQRERYATDQTVRDRCIENADIRRVRKANVTGKHTKAEWLARLVEFNNRCAFCDVELTNEKGPTKRTKEHLIPVVYGADSSHNISNIVPACSKCNSSKCDRLPLEYIWAHT